MAGETIRNYAAAWVDLEANGASIANNAFVEANDNGYSMATDGGGRLHLEFELELAYTTAPTANTVVELHHVDRSLFDGANHGRDPSANRLGGAVMQVDIDAVGGSAAQRWRFDVMFAPTDARYWLRNVATGQTINAGWKLRCRAWSLKAA